MKIKKVLLFLGTVSADPAFFCSSNKEKGYGGLDRYI